MIIKSLEIYGYGQFVQRKIEFNKNLVFQLKSLKNQG